ncbi:hypothetical protein [Ruminococcus sp. NK3A76]|uniref:DUF7668 domain-containing protein n=1 Tax=Ruminococcus sp. NK3A76 TaxID=877411 RepID=UPI000691DD81|nr:hypothetical protein [Ruminococcus sp. NK3A76]
MTEQEAKVLAEPIVKEIVDCMADGRYDLIPKYAGFQDETTTVDDFKEWAEGYLEDNELSHYDRYGVPNNFQPAYDKSLYHQFSVYLYNNGTGFEVDYDLTTDSKLNDLTLIMEFLFSDNGIKANIVDIHVL